MTDAYWKRKSLSEMTDEEWEGLCDGCALCCMHKLEDEETGEVYYTDVACRLLDLESCRCSDYPRRHAKVPDCVKIELETMGDGSWLPGTCAYRRLAEGRPLAWWHPLVSGSSETVHEAGISVRGKCVSEKLIAEEDLWGAVVRWPVAEGE